ncbi:ketosteroid isomerase-like protein [Actinocorallia herbida]|uniref:Ketosteroid isomerase-like protein n=1 Tax=Actinocorallia herbida TaxID=58109 RepID=A0A3N1D0K7_9ACTN|nr:nuclear transport factor 2 family protein [Actinocorallia herbida]ROO87057.1 ketosteroid isomerase-like protein [Actinocorallia herbida]
MSRATAAAFFAAIESGDIDAVRALYAPDAVIWHNDDLVEQTVEENLMVLGGLQRIARHLRYEILRQADTGDGVLQQHILHVGLPDGRDFGLNVAIYVQVKDGRVTRIEEYLDSAQRAHISRFREALAD